MKAGEVFVLLLFCSFCSFEPFGTCCILLVCLGLPPSFLFYLIYSLLCLPIKNFRVYYSVGEEGRAFWETWGYKGCERINGVLEGSLMWFSSPSKCVIMGGSPHP